MWTAFCTIGYGALYTALPKTRDPDVIIVHGAGLIDGRVSPLLASRLDKAVDIYHAGGDRAILIPSGGQGDDEPVSEACAMADYLLTHGVSAEHIVPEDQSWTTEENMRFSKESIARRGIGNPTAVFVTSSYHVFRTALIARRVGLEGEGVGSKTVHYYLPSAIIREFVAIVVLYKWWHIIPAVLLVDLLIIGVVVR